MNEELILASGSVIRKKLLSNANLNVLAVPENIDEDLIKKSLLIEDAKPRDIADFLAEQKAKKVSNRYASSLVLGCDQVLEFENQILDKPSSKNDALEQLTSMRGKSHKLLSAAVLYHEGAPIWRHIGQVRLHMAQITDSYISDYIERNWTDIKHSVGAYQLEKEGIRLFERIEGDYFNVLGLPLVELLSYLSLRGTIER